MFGCSGRLSAEVVQDLIAAGEDMIVFVRATSDRGRLEDLDVDYVVGDLLDAVINTVARRPGETTPYVIGEQNIAAAIEEMDLTRMILFSATGAGNSKSTIPPPFYEEFEKTYTDRGLMEKIVKDGGTPYTFIRLGAVHDKPETGTGRMVEEPILGPITRADAARLAVDCLRATRCLNKIFHATDGSLPLLPEE